MKLLRIIIFVLAFAIVLELGTWLLFGKRHFANILSEDISATVSGKILIYADYIDISSRDYGVLLTRIMQTGAVTKIIIVSGDPRPPRIEQSDEKCNIDSDYSLGISSYMNYPLYAQIRWGVSSGSLAGKIYRSRYLWLFGAWVTIEKGKIVAIA